MRVLVPYSTRDPKSRLAPFLDADERVSFARRMLEDVLTAIRDAGHAPEVIATGAVAGLDVPVIVDERHLSPAVNAQLDPPVAIVMADLALATPVAIQRLVETPGDVVLVPGRGGGTNALVVRDAAFRVDFHGNSIADHRDGARRSDCTTTEVDSYRLSTDVDEPADLVEVLLHGSGRSTGWLREQGIRLRPTEGHVDVERP